MRVACRLYLCELPEGARRASRRDKLHAAIELLLLGQHVRSVGVIEETWRPGLHLGIALPLALLRRTGLALSFVPCSMLHVMQHIRYYTVHPVPRDESGKGTVGTNVSLWDRSRKLNPSASPLTFLFQLIRTFPRS